MRLLDLAPVSEGRLTGEVTFSGDPASGSAIARLSGTIADEPIDTLFVRAALVPGAIHIDEARARVRQAEVEGARSSRRAGFSRPRRMSRIWTRRCFRGGAFLRIRRTGA